MKQITFVRYRQVAKRTYLGVVAITLLGVTFAWNQPVVAHSAATISEGMRIEVIKAHNDVRRRVAQAESQRLGSTVDIPMMLWSEHIAAVAQGWADQQAIQLQQGQARPEHRPNNGYGENMYWGGGHQQGG